MATPQHEPDLPHPVISLNGRLVSLDSLPLSPLDRGFTLGDGVFETMKVAGGIVWYLDRHLERLAHGAAKLGITVPTQLRHWTEEVIRHAEVKSRTSYALRMTLTRGTIQVSGLANHSPPHPTVAITTSDLPHRQQGLYERGLQAHISSTRRYELAAIAGIKTTNYLESVLALREASTAGYDEAIFLDTRGFVSEASASNIFLWRYGKLMTPSRSCGILPGITRAVILELAAAAGIPTSECEIPVSELYQSEELFLTSSLREIISVIQVDDHCIGTGIPGPITQRLMASYNSAIERI